MSAEKQIEAVSKKLVELNPGFDGKFVGYSASGTPAIENNVETEVRFSLRGGKDISPIKALNGLKKLSVPYSNLSDLSTLLGMNLTRFNCSRTQITDLSPLQKMPLESLSISQTNVTDLAPLKGMPLNDLDCSETGVSDVSSLAECKTLKYLGLVKTKVTAAGVADLQKALPKCKIEWDDSAKPSTTK